MFGLLPVLCISLSCLTRVYADIRPAGPIGNTSAGQSVIFASDTANATFIGVRSDGDKVRGIALTLSDGSSAVVGDYNDGKYALQTFSFNPNEFLVSAYLRSSSYGYGSLRQIQFTTNEDRTFIGGPDDYDKQIQLNVKGSSICGFGAWVNPDDFINAFLLEISVPPQPNFTDPFPWFETPYVGNQSASHSQVQISSNYSTARSITVYWDGDKIHGLNMTLSDGTTASAGGNTAAPYNLTYQFSEGETISSLNLTSSSYGYTSLRQISFETSLGNSFTAGASGGSQSIQPPITGSKFVGFNAWINSDNFINAFAIRAAKA